MTPRSIFDGRHLRATALGDHPDKLIVTYDHWTDGKTGFAPVRQKSSWVEMGFTHLHLATNCNDWFVNEDLPAALDAIATFARAYPHKVSLAFSMGGYGALLVSRAVAFRQVLLVSPHASYSHNHPPYDRRFASNGVENAFTDKIHAELLNSPRSSADCVIVYDSAMRLDAEHAQAAGRLFRVPERVALAGGGHPATSVLTANERFGLVQKAIIGTPIDTTKMVRVHDKLIAAGKTA